MIVCRSCGQENPDGFRFCPACAASLEEAPPAREERKVVTVLFADLVGFTSQAEKLDPEEVRAILRPYHERLRADLERYGGTVEKFIGDAVMAVFGAPVAHEDDPERAVRAALAIRDALVEEGKLHVRVGITTGEALVSLGARPEAGEGMAAGDVVNTAARLQSAAPVDGVLVDATTFRATERAIEYRAHEPVVAKGKADPVPVWEAAQARAAVGTDVRQTGGVALVGRGKELEALVNSLERARTGEPQLVTLVGVPGIGKSRLVWELFQRVDALPDFVTWRQGRSLPYGEGVSFWALGEMAKAQSGIRETDTPQAVGEKLAAMVAAFVPEEPERGWVEMHMRPLVGLGTDDDLRGDRRAEAFAAWRRFFEGLAEDGPLVLVFEDLHWADDGLLDFIDHLVDRVARVSLLVVATARPELLSRRPGWGGGKPNAQTISLAPLTDEETARLVHTLLDRAVLPAETQASLLERAAGNPLYAEEFVRLLEQERGDAALPESVQGIIAARLDALPPAEKALLQQAAVHGKVFWVGPLEGERWTLEEHLHALERKEFVRRERRSSVAGEVEWAFRHALVRDVAYEQIPRAERGERHLAAASWIESLGRPEDHAELLAHHYLAAFEYGKTGERARAALREAGDRASALNAPAHAIRYYERAVELADEPDPELLFRYGHALHAAGDDRTDEVLEQAALLASPARAAEAHALLAEFWWHHGLRDRSRPHVEQAAELIRDAPPSAAKARVLAEVARFEALAGEPAAALPVALDAYEMAVELGLTELAARALNTVSIARIGLGDRRGAIADLERSIELANSVNSPEVARGYNNLASAVWSESARRATELYLEAVTSGERLGNALVARFAAGVLPSSYFSIGEWDEALRRAESLIAEYEAGMPHYHEAGARDVRATIRYARGAAEEDVLEDLSRGLEAARRVGDAQVVIPTFSRAIQILVELGRVGDARPLVEELRPVLVTVARMNFFVGFALVAPDLGEEELVRAALARAAEDDPRRPAVQAILDGDFARAADTFQDVDGATEAALRLRAARRLVADGRRADADVHLQKALAFYRSVGATRYVREAESLLAAAG